MRTALVMFLAAAITGGVTLSDNTASAHPPDRVAPIAQQVAPRAGTSLFVEWHGTYWKATVLKVAGDGKLVIHYDGWGNEWDETIGLDRARLDAGRGDLHVEWHGNWWPASIKRNLDQGRALIHYDGWGDEWDEVVPAARMKRLARVGQ